MFVNLFILLGFAGCFRIFLLFLFVAIGYYLYWRKPSSSTCREMYSYQAAIIVLFNLLSMILILLREWQDGIPWEQLKTLTIYGGVMLGMYIL